MVVELRVQYCREIFQKSCEDCPTHQVGRRGVYKDCPTPQVGRRGVYKDCPTPRQAAGAYIRIFQPARQAAGAYIRIVQPPGRPQGRIEGLSNPPGGRRGLYNDFLRGLGVNFNFLTLHQIQLYVNYNPYFPLKVKGLGGKNILIHAQRLPLELVLLMKCIQNSITHVYLMLMQIDLCVALIALQLCSFVIALTINLLSEMATLHN